MKAGNILVPRSVNLPSAVPADVPLPPPLLWFLGAEVAEDPPVGEAEGVGHGVADVGLGGASKIFHVKVK